LITYFTTQGREESGTDSTKKEVIDSQVGPHDNEKVTPFRDLGLKKFGVGDSLLGRMDRAGANDNNKSIIVSGQNSSGIVASGGDGLLRDGRGDNLMAKEGGLDEGIVLG